MKKTLLAAALLAGFAGVAQAETSVTLYGILDAGIGYQRISSGDSNLFPSQSKIGVVSNVQNYSRWGLRGSEDLGEGLSAVFTLESGFHPSSGLSLLDERLFGRQATIGVANSAWGQLDIGRQLNMASKYFTSIDPFGENFGPASMGTSFSSANLTRYDNMLMYQSPLIDGLQFGVGYAFNINDNDEANTGFATNDNQRAWTFGVRYMNGPLNVAASYDQLKRSDSITDNFAPGTGGSTGTRINAWLVGGTYDFEVVKLALAFGHTNGGWIQGGTIIGLFNPKFDVLQSHIYRNDFKAKQYMVGLSAPLQQDTNVFASWQMANPNGSFFLTEPLRDEWNNMTTISLGATHDLSKRTSLYALGSYTKGYAFAADLKSTLFAVGVRHLF